MNARQIAAGALLATGALLFAYAANQITGSKATKRPSRAKAIAEWHRPRWGLALALGLATVGIVQFAQAGEGWLVITCWLASVAVLFGAQLSKEARPSFSRLRGEWVYLGGLGLVLGMALLARVYRLDALPYNFDGDFASFGLEARALLRGTQPEILRFGWGPAPLLGEVPAAITMKLFGDNIIGLRASGVAFGLLSILGTYLMGRDLFKPRVGLIGAALLAASYAHLAASREAHYLDSIAFLVLSVYFLILGLRDGRAWAIVASATTTALCLVYFPGRIVLPIVALLLLHWALFERRLLAQRAGLLVLWLLGVMVALGPMLVMFTRDFQDLIAHTANVFILQPHVVRHMMGVYQVDTIPAMLLEQARRSALLFHFYPDSGTQFAIRRPLLDPITAVLFTLGIGLALFRPRRLGHWLLLSWTLLGVVLGSFVEENPPYWTRLIALLPPAALLAALPLDRVFEALQLRAPKVRAARRRALLVISLTSLLLWIGVRNWDTYVEFKGTFATGPTRFARHMAALPSSARAYLVSSVGWNARLREFEFLIPDRIVADLSPEQALTPIDRLGSPTLIVLTPEQKDLVGQLQQLYPEAELTLGPDNAPDSLAFYALELP